MFFCKTVTRIYRLKWAESCYHRIKFMFCMQLICFWIEAVWKNMIKKRPAKRESQFFKEQYCSFQQLKKSYKQWCYRFLWGLNFQQAAATRVIALIDFHPVNNFVPWFRSVICSWNAINIKIILETLRHYTFQAGCNLCWVRKVWCGYKQYLFHGAQISGFLANTVFIHHVQTKEWADSQHSAIRLTILVHRVERLWWDYYKSKSPQILNLDFRTRI